MSKDAAFVSTKFGQRILQQQPQPRMADQALCRAKDEGRNTIVVAD